jgi:hypothetical protein
MFEQNPYESPTVAVTNAPRRPLGLLVWTTLALIVCQLCFTGIKAPATLLMFGSGQISAIAIAGIALATMLLATGGVFLITMPRAAILAFILSAVFGSICMFMWEPRFVSTTILLAEASIVVSILRANSVAKA